MEDIEEYIMSTDCKKLDLSMSNYVFAKNQFLREINRVGNYERKNLLLNLIDLAKLADKSLPHLTQ